MTSQGRTLYVKFDQEFLFFESPPGNPFILEHAIPKDRRGYAEDILFHKYVIHTVTF